MYFPWQPLSSVEGDVVELFVENKYLPRKHLFLQYYFKKLMWFGSWFGWCWCDLVWFHLAKKKNVPTLGPDSLSNSPRVGIIGH